MFPFLIMCFSSHTVLCTGTNFGCFHYLQCHLIYTTQKNTLDMTPGVICWFCWVFFHHINWELLYLTSLLCILYYTTWVLVHSMIKQKHQLNYWTLWVLQAPSLVCPWTAHSEDEIFISGPNPYWKALQWLQNRFSRVSYCNFLWNLPLITKQIAICNGLTAFWIILFLSWENKDFTFL